ncbi:MAG: hypothetical protein JO319_19240 [Acidobacteriaceae bacterium]|nr:hypothetical protein [Acidobacteriaceae bacterium]
MPIGERMAKLQLASDLHALREESRFPPLESRGLQILFPHGIARGEIIEVHGKRSSGRLSVCLHILAGATARGEICAVVDLNGSFDPASAAAAEVRLAKIVWVRCGGNAEHALRAADLLLHAGGFGVVLLDLTEAPARVLNRIPLSYWHRFRRAVANTPSILLLSADTPQAKSCARSTVQMKRKAFHWSGKAPFLVLRKLETLALQQKIAAIRPEPLLLETAA